MEELNVLEKIGKLIERYESPTDNLSKDYIAEFITEIKKICSALRSTFGTPTTIQLTEQISFLKEQDRQFIKSLESSEYSESPIVAEVFLLGERLASIENELNADESETEQLETSMANCNTIKVEHSKSILDDVSTMEIQISLLEQDPFKKTTIQRMKKILGLIKNLLSKITNYYQNLNNIKQIVDQIKKRREGYTKTNKNGKTGLAELNELISRFKDCKYILLTDKKLSEMLTNLNQTEETPVSNTEQTTIYQNYMLSRLSYLLSDIDAFDIANPLNNESGLDYLVGFYAIKARLIGELITIKDFLHERLNNNSGLFDLVSFILNEILPTNFLECSHCPCNQTLEELKINPQYKKPLINTLAIPVDQHFRLVLFETYINGQEMLDCGPNEHDSGLALRVISDGSDRISGKDRTNILKHHLGEMEEGQEAKKSYTGYRKFYQPACVTRKEENYDEFSLFEYLYDRYLNKKSKFYKECGIAGFYEYGIYWENMYAKAPYGKYQALELERETEIVIIQRVIDIVRRILGMQLEYRKFRQLVLKNAYKESVGREKK